MERNNTISETKLLRQIVETQLILAKANFDPNAFMQLVVQEVLSLTPASGAVVGLIEGEYIVYNAVTDTLSNYQHLKLPINNSISGLCIQTKQILYSNDTEQDPRVNLEACRMVAARSLVVVPLVYLSKGIGVLKIVSSKLNAFSEIHIHTLEIMAGFIASGLKHQFLFQEKELIIKKLQKTQERLSHLANHDHLTGLPNRVCFNKTLKLAMDKVLKKQSPIALLYIDIDHFKKINDSLGHDVGDELLIEFSSRLKKTIRKHDFLMRVGGDEFIILLENLTSKNDALVIVMDLLNKTNYEFILNKNMLKITLSIGVSFYHGEAMTPLEFIKQSDNALYLAKKSGRNTFKTLPEEQIQLP